MKRKLAALLAMCMVLTSAFASCGQDEDDDEGSTSKKKSTSSSYAADADDDEDEDDDDDMDDDDEDDDDEDEDDEDEDDDEDDEDDEEVTTKSSKKKKSKDSEDPEPTTDEEEIEITTKKIKKDNKKNSDADAPEEAVGGDIIGKWSFEKGGETYWISFLENGQADIIVSATEMMHFTKDGKFYMSGMELPKETVKNDGKTVKVELSKELQELYDEEEASLLVLKRKDDSDKSTLDGEYTVEGGMLGDALASGLSASFSSISDVDISATIKGEEFSISVKNVFSFSTKGSTLNINGSSSLFDDIGEGSCEYSVSGDSLFLYRKSDNKPVELKRVK